MAVYLLSSIRIKAFSRARSGDFADCRSLETTLEKPKANAPGLR
jgi:hypothetical protein